MLILTAMYGASLDRMPVTRVMTLGGHHVLVMALAVVAILILVGLAWPTEGFTEATPRQRVALVLAGALAAVSAIGTVGFVLAAVSVAFLLLALMSRV
jgi:type IV secretory pathway TrbL component